MLPTQTTIPTQLSAKGVSVVEIKHCTVDDFFTHPGSLALLTEYAAESSIAGMPSPDPNRAAYTALERNGAMALLVALDPAGGLLGFLTLLVSANPHYSAVIGVVESFFVGSTHRKTGAGLGLLRAAERIAGECGAAGFLISAPYGGRLAEVLERHGDYRESNRVFFKALA